MKLVRNKAGFTLIEMVITAVLLGIIAAMAVPDFYRAMQKIKLNSTTRDIISDLRWARSKAIASRTQVGLHFNFDAKTYVVFLDTYNPSGLQYTAGQDSVITTYNLSNIGTASSTFGNNTVIFKPDGTCNTSGQVTCNSTDNNNTHVVDVLSSTGRIKITS